MQRREGASLAIRALTIMLAHSSTGCLPDGRLALSPIPVDSCCPAGRLKQSVSPADVSGHSSRWQACVD